MLKTRKRILDITMGIGFLIILVGISVLGWSAPNLGPREAYTMALIEHPANEIWFLTTKMGEAPFFYLILHLLWSLIGKNSFLALHLISSLGIFIMVGLGFGPVRQVLGYRTGILFSWLWILSALVYPSSEGMPWITLFTTSGLLYFYIFYAKGQKMSGFLGGILMLAGCYTHGVTLLVLGVLLVIFLFRSRQDERKQRKYSLIILGLVIVACIPLFYSWIYSWVNKFSRGILWLAWVKSLIYPLDLSFRTLPFYGLFWIAAVAIIYAGHRWVRRSGDGAQWVFRYFFKIAGTVFGIVTMILALTGTDYWKNAYFPLVGTFLLLLAYGLSHLGGFRFKIAACLVLAMTLTPVLIELKERREYRIYHNAVNHLKPRLEFGDVFVHLDPETDLVFSHYFPGRKHIIFQLPDKHRSIITAVLQESNEVVTDVRDLPKGRRVWLVREMRSDNLYLHGKASIVLGGWLWNAKLFRVKGEPLSMTVELIEPDSIYRH